MNILHRFTRKTLQSNRTRTIVTIVGIMLSVATITAVTTFISSLQSFLVETEVLSSGTWHGVVYDATEEQRANAQNSGEMEAGGICQKIGYAQLEAPQNEDKPYLYLAGIDKGFQNMIPISLISGRMPTAENEILIPEHLIFTEEEFGDSLGKTLELELGERRASDGSSLSQQNLLLRTESGESAETVVPQRKQTYTVVGVYERPRFESYYAPGYTVLTCMESRVSGNADFYVQMKHPKEVFSFVETYFDGENAEYHYDLLRYIGASNERSFNGVLYNLAFILIAIIMGASILLIHNAFSISVSERTRQFGLLSSVGATKHQLKRSVLYEAVALSIIGIPLGVFLGIAGIGVTLKLTAHLFAQSLFANSEATFHLAVSWEAVAVAVVVGFVTILLSAYWPAKRAVRQSTVDAIRQSQDIKLSTKQVKTGKLTYRLFGVEGMLAQKNFKRSKKRYRSTVISLFVSIVLFISTSSFCAYLNRSVNSVVDDTECSIYYTYFDAQSGQETQQEKRSFEALYQQLKGAEGVTKGSYFSIGDVEVQIPFEKMSREFQGYYKDQVEAQTDAAATEYELKNGMIQTYAWMLFIEDEAYEAYLTEHGYDPAVYMNTESPVALALDNQKRYHSEEGKYYTFHLLNRAEIQLDAICVKELSGYESEGWSTPEEDDVRAYSFRSIENPEESLVLSQEEATQRKTLPVGTTSDDAPLGVDLYQGTQLCLCYPYSALETMKEMGYGMRSSDITMSFVSDQHKKTYQQQETILDQYQLSSSTLIDLEEAMENERALITICNVFAYGFIILISLIAAANVFNTISTNLDLRRREFAVLKSVGMEEKGIRRMMQYECLLYGLKGLAFGIPVSVLVTYLIYRSLSKGLNVPFLLPVSSFVIAVFSVFAVVFATMIYARRKRRGENVVDALKLEVL
jgi:putative ABC transport system permease protein